MLNQSNIDPCLCIDECRYVQDKRTLEKSYRTCRMKRT